MKPTIRSGPGGDFFVPKTSYYVIATRKSDGVRAIAPCVTMSSALLTAEYVRQKVKGYERIAYVDSLPRQQRGYEWLLLDQWPILAEKWGSQ